MSNLIGKIENNLLK